MSPQQAAARIDAALSAGDLFPAYDLASEGLKRFPDSLLLKHRAVLALARLRAIGRAQELYDQWKLSEASSGDRQLDIDLAALGGRLAKDRAWHETGPARWRFLLEAAGFYNEAFRRSGDGYPGANAAALFLWAGDRERARETAARALAAVRGEDFYAHATRAECQLILGRSEIAAEALRKAAKAGGDVQQCATARRQLRRTCDVLGIATELLEAIATPPVIQFLGHMPGKRFPPENEAAAAKGIAALLDELDAKIGYGALAAGADILFAEALLGRGAELNAVLPFAIDEFKRVSVAPAGAGWAERFERCLERASSVRLSSDDKYLGDDTLFSLGSQLAAGLAVLRAEGLDAPAVQTVLWDGEAPGGAGGTGDDVMRWQALGRPQKILNPDGSPRHDWTVPDWPPPAVARDARHIRPVVFGDVAGFSKLSEAQLPAFMSAVFGTYAGTLEPFAEKILSRNTWGDGLFLVFDAVETAAAAALALSEAAAAIDYAAHGLPPTLGLRLGGHLGPVARLDDPVAQRQSWLGVQVSRAARIEPVVPPGTVYVSETFAAALALLPGRPYAADYVGRLETAKGAGPMALFSLRRG